MSVRKEKKTEAMNQEERKVSEEYGRGKESKGTEESKLI